MTSYDNFRLLMKPHEEDHFRNLEYPVEEEIQDVSRHLHTCQKKWRKENSGRYDLGIGAGVEQIKHLEQYLKIEKENLRYSPRTFSVLTQLMTFLMPCCEKHTSSKPVTPADWNCKTRVHSVYFVPVDFPEWPEAPVSPGTQVIRDIHKRFAGLARLLMECGVLAEQRLLVLRDRTLRMRSDQLLLPDALLLAAMNGHLQCVRLLLPHFPSPPLSLLLFSGLFPEHVVPLFPVLLHHQAGQPLPVPLLDALSNHLPHLNLPESFLEPLYELHGCAGPMALRAAPTHIPPEESSDTEHSDSDEETDSSALYPMESSSPMTPSTTAAPFAFPSTSGLESCLLSVHVTPLTSASKSTEGEVSAAPRKPSSLPVYCGRRSSGFTVTLDQLGLLAGRKRELYEEAMRNAAAVDAAGQLGAEEEEGSPLMPQRTGESASAESASSQESRPGGEMSDAELTSSTELQGISALSLMPHWGLLTMPSLMVLSAQAARLQLGREAAELNISLTRIIEQCALPEELSSLLRMDSPEGTDLSVCPCPGGDLHLVVALDCMPTRNGPSC